MIKKIISQIHIPTIKKICINRCLGNLAQNKVILQKSINEFCLITGQYPRSTYAKKSISGFKLREKTLIGLTTTLRKNRMYSFLIRLIHFALPQLRDFKGFSLKQFDTFGNYHFGIKNQVIFPELNSEDIPYLFGFNISIITSITNLNENISLLKSLDFPFE
uniref:50S ribosomal protein L5, chloroplastic n=1 Tax=Pteridomonas sp. YPF1301 TaxID=2766739 RepID=A0A7G1MQD6_9STRA|nr:ribosomal protein L5 [Pteridomonas sp. YPF1301]